MEPIPYAKQFVDEDDIEAVVKVLRSSHLTQGSKVTEFEALFSSYVDASYGLAVSSGTAGLHLAVKALGLKPGEKVLTTSNTFVATANSVLYEKGQIDFVDIDPKTYLMDLGKLEEKLARSKPGEFKGVIVVDFGGCPIDLERLAKITHKFGLWIIEDACHALGARFQDSKGVWQKTGNCKFADVSVFSFHPVKHITSGEGGLITTNRKELFDKMALLRSHGITKDSALFTQESHGGWYYEMQDLGYNYRLSDINCALACSQLKKIDTFLARRKEIAKFYNTELKGLKNFFLAETNPRFENSYHLYVCRATNRKALYDYLRERNIFSQVLYIPVHQQPYYRKIHNWNDVLPETNKYYESALALPMYATLKDEEMQLIVDSIKSFYRS